MQVGSARISRGQTESEKLTHALGRLGSLLRCQSNGFTSAAGSGDGSAGASSSSASFASHARMQPSCTSSSCRSSPSGSSSVALSRSGPLFSKRLPLVCSSRAFAKSARNSSSGTSKCFQAVAVRCAVCACCTAACRRCRMLPVIVGLSTGSPRRTGAANTPQSPEIRSIKRLAN